jgi:hypothetical protein
MEELKKALKSLESICIGSNDRVVISSNGGKKYRLVR